MQHWLCDCLNSASMQNRKDKSSQLHGWVTHLHAGAFSWGRRDSLCQVDLDVCRPHREHRLRECQSQEHLRLTHGRCVGTSRQCWRCQPPFRPACMAQVPEYYHDASSMHRCMIASAGHMLLLRLSRGLQWCREGHLQSLRQQEACLFGTDPDIEPAGKALPSQSCSTPAAIESATAVLFAPVACCCCTYPLMRYCPHAASGRMTRMVPAPDKT